MIDRFEDRRLNEPNDVVVHLDGGIWFTDPGYGIHWNYEGDNAGLRYRLVEVFPAG